MRLEIVHHLHEFFCLGIVLVNELTHERGPVLLGPTPAHPHEALAPKGSQATNTLTVP
jgi:hypothetical protein